MLMLRTALFYGLALAALAAFLELVAYRHLIRLLPTDVYILAVAGVFVVLGLWAGIAMTPGRKSENFEHNAQAARALGLTSRELEVLALLGRGEANKEIARSLEISPHTVKTHVTSLFEKLGVSGRGRAVMAARELCLIP